MGYWARIYEGFDGADDWHLLYDFEDMAQAERAARLLGGHWIDHAPGAQCWVSKNMFQIRTVAEALLRSPTGRLTENQIIYALKTRYNR